MVDFILDGSRETRQGLEWGLEVPHRQARKSPVWRVIRAVVSVSSATRK